ncbi:MAG: septum formation initiator family protein [Candidatus Nealsonbacteria bacterium]|nr:septum formation initiator family protein [Candidatus Nealsonbacteria bacterium]
MITRTKRTKRDFYENLFFSVLLIVLIFAIVGFLVVSNIRASKKRGELQSQIQTLKKEIQSLEDKKKELTGRAGESNNGEFLEREARERFNLQKPGEEVVTIVPFEKSGESKSEEGKNKKSWWNILGF